jgi:hypothetical protein
MLLESLKAPERKYVTLDNFEERSLANQDPQLFLQKYAPPVNLQTYIERYIPGRRRLLCEESPVEAVVVQQGA